MTLRHLNWAVRSAVLAGALTATACASTTSGPVVYPGPGAGGEETRDGRTAPFDPLAPNAPLEPDTTLDVAVLLPFSAPSAAARREAGAMMAAIEVALFDVGRDDIVVTPKDTAGAAASARAVARDALANGADVIIGPLFADAVQAAASEARLYNVPVLGFSNDASAAGGGVYLVGSTPEDEVARILSFATEDLEGDDIAGAVRPPGGFSAGLGPSLYTPEPLARVAVLAPDNAYGRRVATAVRSADVRGDAILSHLGFFPASGDATALTPVAQAASEAARSTPGTGPSGLAFDAVLLPVGGVSLLSLAPLLPYYDLDPREVQLLGTSAWNDEDVAREPALAGGLFPAPDPQRSTAFDDRFESAAQTAATRLAPLAYDALAIVAAATPRAAIPGGEPQLGDLEREEGFMGVHGPLRFRADGTVERAMAILEVRGGTFVVVDPAPERLAPPDPLVVN